jgi:adenylosuccinate synthase
MTSAVLTRLDVLDTLPELSICTSYRVGGVDSKSFPANLTALSRCEPVYESMPGWQQPTSDARTFGDLPAAAQNYVRRLESLLGCPVSLISVGPERGQAVYLREIT